MVNLYDLVFAEFLQVWLHRAHQANARVVNDEARLLDFLEQVLAEAGQLVGAHPGALLLLADLRTLALRVEARTPLTPSALKQELAGALYAALRQSTVPGVPPFVPSCAPRADASHGAIGMA